MFLLILILIASQKPIRDTTFVTVGNDTVWITPDSIWSTSADFTISGAVASSYGNFSDSIYSPVLRADYAEITDSLWAKILRGEYGVLDSLLADTLKGYLKGKADSAVNADTSDYAKNSLDSLTAEQWVMEERVDTIYVTQMNYTNNRGGLLSTGSNEGTETDYLYFQLNADGEYWWYDLREITCDSARLDSINWQLYVAATDADTILLGYIDPSGGNLYQASFVTTDTIIVSSAQQVDTTQIFDRRINKSNKRYFPYCNLYETSNKVYIARLILYYHAYNKRYGIPE